MDDNENDISHLDRERDSNTDNSYFDSKDYFLYKKYKKLAEKYKTRLLRKYKNIKKDDLIEGFESPVTIDTRNEKRMNDLLIFVIVGIFIIFILDTFVKLGKKMNKKNYLNFEKIFVRGTNSLISLNVSFFFLVRLFAKFNEILFL